MMAHAALYALTALSIGRVHELFDFLMPLRIVFVMGSAAIILALLTPPTERHPVLAQPEVRVVLALVVLGVALMPFSVWPGGSWGFLTGSYSKVVVLFVLIVALATSLRVIRNLVWSVLAGVGLLGLFTIAGASIMTGREYSTGRAYASATYDPNDVAMIMVCALPLAVLAATGHRGLRRAIAASVAVVCVLATIMTLSRGGFIGLGFVSILLLFRLGPASGGFRLTMLSVIVALLVVAAPPDYWNVMSTIWSPTDTSYVAQGVFSRMELWQRGLKLFLQNVVTGVGIGMFEIADGLAHGRRGGWVAAHNSFIQLAAELGVVGLALFLALLVLSVRNARRTQQAANADAGLRDLGWIAAAAEASLYTYMVVGFALSQAYSSMLYLLVGLTSALRLQVEARWRSVIAGHAEPNRDGGDATARWHPQPPPLGQPCD